MTTDNVAPPPRTESSVSIPDTDTEKETTTTSANDNDTPDVSNNNHTTVQQQQQQQEEEDVDQVTSALQQGLQLVEEEDATTVLWDPEIGTVKEWISQSNRIVVVAGAGMSVAAGIPDFRTPGIGLYDNLQLYQLPYPEAIFDIEYYQQHPTPFCKLAKELWPTTPERNPKKNRTDNKNAKDPNTKHKKPSTTASQTIRPTLTHCFLALLAGRTANNTTTNTNNDSPSDNGDPKSLSISNRLKRVYTQNIDGLEYLAGVPEDLLVECHGHFRTASCISCGQQVDIDMVKTCIQNYNHNDTETSKPPTCPSCTGLVKPDIVFFGEGLPGRFFQCLQHDLHTTDLVLVIGTSLQVAPVCNIPNQVKSSTKRVLINLEAVGNFRTHTPRMAKSTTNTTNNNQEATQRRDAVILGDCDASILQLCHALGWQEELQTLYEHVQAME